MGLIIRLVRARLWAKLWAGFLSAEQIRLMNTALFSLARF